MAANNDMSSSKYIGILSKKNLSYLSNPIVRPKY